MRLIFGCCSPCATRCAFRCPSANAMPRQACPVLPVQLIKCKTVESARETSPTALLLLNLLLDIPEVLMLR